MILNPVIAGGGGVETVKGTITHENSIASSTNPWKIYYVSKEQTVKIVSLKYKETVTLEVQKGSMIIIPFNAQSYPQVSGGIKTLSREAAVYEVTGDFTAYLVTGGGSN